MSKCINNCGLNEACNLCNKPDNLVTLPVAVREWFVCASYSLQGDYIGKFLTIIEASIHDPEQRKALKDVVKQMFDRTDDKIRMYGEQLHNDVACITEPDFKIPATIYDAKIPVLMDLDYKYTRKD